MRRVSGVILAVGCSAFTTTLPQLGSHSCLYQPPSCIDAGVLSPLLLLSPPPASVQRTRCVVLCDHVAMGGGAEPEQCYTRRRRLRVALRERVQQFRARIRPRAQRSLQSALQFVLCALLLLPVAGPALAKGRSVGHSNAATVEAAADTRTASRATAADNSAQARTWRVRARSTVQQEAPVRQAQQRQGEGLGSSVLQCQGEGVQQVSAWGEDVRSSGSTLASVQPGRAVPGLGFLKDTVKEASNHVSAIERDTMILLLATALVTPIMGMISLSPVLGFLFAGIVLGPFGFALISDVGTTTKLAELGVVFFLFEMGLELELERLKAVGRDAFRLGSAQFLTTAVLIGGAARFLGATAASALVLGGGFALSSSAFVIQLLSEKGELATRFGRASFGILLFQDLAVVPLLVVTPLLGGTSAALIPALRSAAIKSVAALSIIFVAGRYALQPVYKLVAAAKDQTAFLAITLLTVLSMSAFTLALGLSDTLGAFLAGVLLAETKYRYQIEADIAPFRGLLLGLFFITTGFSIDLPLALANLPLVLGGTAALHLVKTAITAAVCTLGGLKVPAALRSGLLLSQGGEFAFVLFGLAQTHGILLPRQVKLLLTTVVLSMFLTPFLNEGGARVAKRLETARGGLMLPSPDEAEESSDYVLVCGFGRVGQEVCKLLTGKLIRYKAFDLDPYRVAEARAKGLPVFYGDARRPDVLQAIMKEESSRISSVAVCLDRESDCTRTVRALRREYPTVTEMPIFVRAVDDKHRRKLAASGANAVETGPQESALLLGGALLTNLGVPQEEVAALIDEKRARLYNDKMGMLVGDLFNPKTKDDQPKDDKVLDVSAETGN